MASPDNPTSSGTNDNLHGHKEQRNASAVEKPGDEDDESVSSGSESGRSSVSDDRTGLFISSTISRDDTHSKVSKKRGLLSTLNEQFNSGPLQLNSSNGPRNPYGLGRGAQQLPPPVVPGPPPGFGLQPGRLVRPGGPLRGAYPPGVRRPQPMPPLPPTNWGHRQPRYPNWKASKNAKWRQKLQQKRGPLAELSTEQQEQPADAALTHGSPRSSSQPDDPKTEEDGDSQTSIKPPLAEKPAKEEPGLAESLSALAERHLSINVLDQTKEVSQFVSYLLDTIQMLESQVRYHGADAYSTSSDSDSEDISVPRRSTVPCSRVIHRIFCTNMLHNHDGDLYEDEPKPRKVTSPGDAGGIDAREEIINLNAYLNKHSEYCFVVIKEHDCARYQRAAHVRTRTTGKASVSSVRSERLRIASPVLQKALEQVAEFQIYDEENQDANFPEMDAPYTFLFHHRSKLATLTETEPYKAVVSPLLEFLKDNYEKEYTEAETMFREGYVNAHHIHKLFKPNQMVISRKNPEMVDAHVLNAYSVTEKETIQLQGWDWHYNGADLQRTPWKGSINSVAEDKVKISDLTIHPAEFAREGNVKRLKARGEKFWEMKGQIYTCYTGWDKAHGHHYTSARFMVDMATYQLMHGRSTSSAHEDPPKYDPWPMKINRREELPANVVMLCPATIYGFNLHEKKWVILNIENFHPIVWNKKAFERLVLEDKTKEMIYALVDVQTSAKKMDDIITGKGNGLIVLLHGSPGTGKTLTAESVAEIAEKPLYRVTCGDIGIDARDVEMYLETVLYLGKIWDCVLLLDEADVFLEERTMADLQRNSLVSVFLRILEYYEGILILTSNRVGTFDEAFKSRIQVAIHYDNLTKKSRKAIWQNFFDMIEESNDEDANMPELERRLDQLSSEEMNGRQIRNALLTARQLAKHRNERLDWEHLSQVMKTSAAFNKYLKAIRGHSDEQWAREEMLR